MKIWKRICGITTAAAVLLLFSSVGLRDSFISPPSWINWFTVAGILCLIPLVLSIFLPKGDK